MDSKDRVTIDCRGQAEAKGCTLSISGTEQEVLEIAERHVITKHGFKQEPGLQEKLRGLLKHEAVV